MPSCNRPSVLSYLDVGRRLASKWWRLREQSSIIKHQAERFKLVVDDVITRFLQIDAVDAHLYTSDVLPEHNRERNSACKHVNIEKYHRFELEGLILVNVESRNYIVTSKIIESLCTCLLST